MKTITGYLAILLGAVGALLILAVIGLVWWGAFKLTTPINYAATQADQSLVQAEEAFDHLKQQLVSTAEPVEAVRVSAARAAGGRPNAPLTKAELEQLRTDLLPLVDRADAMHEVLPPIAETLDDAANLAESAGNTARASRLRSIADAVRAAAKDLDLIRARAAAIRRGESTPTAKELEGLAQQTRRSLDLLISALSEVKQESERLRKELPETQRALNYWKITGAAVVTGVLSWTGLGQLAIVAWGRRRLASRWVTAPQPAGTK